jgi:hypothetical protein
MPGKMHIGRSIDQPDVIKNTSTLRFLCPGASWKISFR